MRTHILIILVVLTVVSTSSLAAQIPPFYLDSTVVIGVPNDKGQTSWVASGFILGALVDKASKVKQYKTYLVTNRHVIKDLKVMVIRFNSEDQKGSMDYIINVSDVKGSLWAGHHDEGVDVAVMPINTNVLKSDKVKFNFIHDDSHVYTLKDMQEIGVTEGDPIYLLGYPMGIVDSELQFVIARYGIIARIRDTLSNHGKSYLIDTKNYPGNSGGPVILKTEATSIEGTKSNQKAQLIGIVNSYIPYTDVAISTQTKRARITFEENSGLANVIPMDYVLETIHDYETLQKQQ